VISFISTLVLIAALLFVTFRSFGWIVSSRVARGSGYEGSFMDEPCWEESVVYEGSYYDVYEYFDGAERGLYVSCFKGIGGVDGLEFDALDECLNADVREDADRALVACCQWQADREDERYFATPMLEDEDIPF
jgi:hypothetical protein